MVDKVLLDMSSSNPEPHMEFRQRSLDAPRGSWDTAARSSSRLESSQGTEVSVATLGLANTILAASLPRFTTARSSEEGTTALGSSSLDSNWKNILPVGDCRVPLFSLSRSTNS